ncbi:MAG TPA: hypothetical protein VGH90_05640 [Chthoniobacteraceae bacterium]|jgi:Spy/CpxP family protein refolding chaperone
MKLITFVLLLSGLSPLFAAEKTASSEDPLAGAFFPPEAVLLARDLIGLTPAQQTAFRDRVQQTQPRLDELERRVKAEAAALAAVAKREPVDEAALMAQLDKELEAEREAKRLHLGLLAWIKNLLTPEQQANLRTLVADGGAKLNEATRKRLTEKVERIQEGAQKWAESGRDASAIATAMQEKIKPLLDAGKPIEAEAEIDQVLKELDQPTK